MRERPGINPFRNGPTRERAERIAASRWTSERARSPLFADQIPAPDPRRIVAEYRALVEGLRKAVETGVEELQVVSDSELVVKQMRGEYRVKNEALQDLFLQASRLARKLDDVEYRHVKRAHNELADRLVNEALDAA